VGSVAKDSDRNYTRNSSSISRLRMREGELKEGNHV